MLDFHGTSFRPFTSQGYRGKFAKIFANIPYDDETIAAQKEAKDIKIPAVYERLEAAL